MRSDQLGASPKEGRNMYEKHGGSMRVWAGALRAHGRLCGHRLGGGACSPGTRINLGSGQGADPATVDFPIFYVKRTIPMMSDDLRLLRPAVPQANLYMRATASPSAVETNITARVTGTDSYDVKDVSVSADGTMVLFAMRGPLTPNMKDIDPPTWAIWQYTIASDTLARVIRMTIRPMTARTSRRHFCPTGASCSPRRGSGNRRPCCSMRTIRSSNIRPRTATSRPSCSP
jgi:hypothetical protein